MKLITEEVTNVKIITEGKGDNKKLYIEGVFLQGEIKNRNGRMYPITVLSREVDRYNEQFVSKGRALGELGHPDGPTVNLDRVSHKITSLTQEGNNFIGKAQILNTPMGKIASSLLDEGVMLGVSSRGVGSLQTTSEGHKVVGEDFMLATAADIVADPSGAKRNYDKALALDPDYTSAVLNKAGLYLLRGDSKSALLILRKHLPHASDKEEIQGLIQRIEKGI